MRHAPVALALSPHLDDAAFSCGATLARLAADGWTVVVATLFTASVPDPRGFALACQLDKGLRPEIDYMALRRAEDVAAMAELGVAAPVHGRHREAPHRGYHSATALFEPPHALDAVVDDLAPDLRGLLADRSPDLVLAPQAIGGHVDHVQLVGALDRVRPRTPILWWRDFPYTASGAAPKAPYGRRFDGLAEVELVPGCGADGRKARACAAYASQIGFQFGGPEGLRERLAATAGRERFRLDGGFPERFPALLAA